MSETTNESKKRLFLQIELSEDEKEEIRGFCKRHHIKQSVFGRQAIRFFLNREVLPVAFESEKQESASLELDISKFADPLMKEFKAVREKLELLDSGLLSVRKDLANSNIAITSEVAQYIARISSKIEKLKEGD